MEMMVQKRLMNPRRAGRILIGWFICAISWPGIASSQTLSEQVLGSVSVAVNAGTARIVSPRGDNLAIRERVGSKERYVTLQGPGPEFDRILTGGVWIQDRLVYYGERGGKFHLVDGKKTISLAGTPTSPLALGRIWPSPDQTHYIAFVTDGKSISWYADGIRQATNFDKLNNANITFPPNSTPIFVGTKNCVVKVVGHTPSAKAGWDLVHWTSSSADSSTMYVYGESVGRMLLHRNGITIFKEPLQRFLSSRDGKKWIAVVDRSTESASRLELIEDGKKVAEANVDPTRHTAYLASGGSTWVWKIYDEDYVGVTLRQPGRADRRLSRDPAEYYLAEDGSREAYLVATADAPPKVEIVVEGKPVAVVADVRAQSFRFGPSTGFAFEARDGGSKSIVSHVGRGPNFDDVSSVLFLPDGRPVYAARTGADNFIVIGTSQIAIPADSLHSLNTLRLEGSTVKVLGTRGSNLVAFSIAN